jgi:16S rRNA (cytosine1402-N4)-methyltransferase
VLVEEVIVALSPRPGSFQIDATAGGGGHAARILEAANPDGRLLAIDADLRAIERTRRRLAEHSDRVTLRHANFEAIGEVARESGFDQVDGILLDLGLSSPQLDRDERGFSFRSTGALDMRFDDTRGVPASEVLATLGEDELASIFRRYGEEPHARRIARSIVARREHGPIRTPVELADLVVAAVPAAARRSRIHPATRVFQALRIHVNRELEVLPAALDQCLDLLRPDGRLCVISYHSLEDRIVKRFFARERRGCVCPPELPVCVCGRQPRLAPVGRQPQVPTDAEIAENPRSRSARLRAARRIAA